MILKAFILVGILILREGSLLAEKNFYIDPSNDIQNTFPSLMHERSLDADKHVVTPVLLNSTVKRFRATASDSLAASLSDDVSLNPLQISKGELNEELHEHLEGNTGGLLHRTKRETSGKNTTTNSIQTKRNDTDIAAGNSVAPTLANRRAKSTIQSNIDKSHTTVTKNSPEGHRAEDTSSSSADESAHEQGAEAEPNPYLRVIPKQPIKLIDKVGVGAHTLSSEANDDPSFERESFEETIVNSSKLKKITLYRNTGRLENETNTLSSVSRLKTLQNSLKPEPYSAFHSDSEESDGHRSALSGNEEFLMDDLSASESESHFSLEAGNDEIFQGPQFPEKFLQMRKTKGGSEEQQNTKTRAKQQKNRAHGKKNGAKRKNNKAKQTRTDKRASFGKRQSDSEEGDLRRAKKKQIYKSKQALPSEDNSSSDHHRSENEGNDEFIENLPEKRLKFGHVKEGSEELSVEDVVGLDKYSLSQLSEEEDSGDTLANESTNSLSQGSEDEEDKDKHKYKKRKQEKLRLRAKKVKLREDQSDADISESTKPRKQRYNAELSKELEILSENLGSDTIHKESKSKQVNKKRVKHRDNAEASNESELVEISSKNQKSRRRSQLKQKKYYMSSSGLDDHTDELSLSESLQAGVAPDKVEKHQSRKIPTYKKEHIGSSGEEKENTVDENNKTKTSKRRLKMSNKLPGKNHRALRKSVEYDTSEEGVSPEDASPRRKPKDPIRVTRNMGASAEKYNDQDMLGIRSTETKDNRKMGASAENYIDKDMLGIRSTETKDNRKIGASAEKYNDKDMLGIRSTETKDTNASSIKESKVGAKKSNTISKLSQTTGSGDSKPQEGEYELIRKYTKKQHIQSGKHIIPDEDEQKQSRRPKKSEEYETSEEAAPPNQAMRRSNKPSQYNKKAGVSAEKDVFAGKLEKLQLEMHPRTPKRSALHTSQVRESLELNTTRKEKTYIRPSNINKNEGASAETMAAKRVSHTLRKGSETSKKPTQTLTDQLGGSQQFLTSVEKGPKSPNEKQKTSRRPLTLGQSSDVSLSEPLKSRENTGGSGNVATGRITSEEYGNSEEITSSHKKVRTAGPSELNKNEGASAEAVEEKKKTHKLQKGTESSQKPKTQTDQLGESQEFLTSAKKVRKSTTIKQKTSRRPSTLGQSGDISLTESLESKENTVGSGNIPTGPDNSEEYGNSTEIISSHKTFRTAEPSELNKSEGASAETVEDQRKSHTLRKGTESSQKPTTQTDQLGESQKFFTSAENGRNSTTEKQKTSRRPSTLGQSGDISLTESLESKENTVGSGNDTKGPDTSEEYDNSEEGEHPDQAIRRRRPSEPSQRYKNYGHSVEKERKTEKLQLDIHSISPKTPPQHTGRVTGSQESLTSAEKARKTTSIKQETSRRPSTLGQSSDISLTESLESKDNTGGSGNIATGPDNSEEYGNSEEIISSNKTVWTGGHKKPSEISKNEGASVEAVADKRKSHTLRKGTESSQKSTPLNDQMGESHELLTSVEKRRKSTTEKPKTSRKPSISGQSSDSSQREPFTSRKNTGGSTNDATGLKKSEEYDTSEESIYPDQAMRRQRSNKPSQGHKNYTHSIEKDMHSKSPQTSPQHAGQVRDSQDSPTSAEKARKPTTKKHETSRTLGHQSNLSEPLQSRENAGRSGIVEIGADKSEEYGISEESISSEKTIRTEGEKKPSELNKNEGASAESVTGKKKSHTLPKGSKSSKKPKSQNELLGESQETSTSAEKERNPRIRKQKTSRRPSILGQSGDINLSAPLESRENTGGSTNVEKGLNNSEEYGTSEEGVNPDQAMRRQRPNEPSQRHKNHSRSAEMDEFAEKRENLQHTGRVKGSQESLTSAEKTGRTTSKKPETSRRPSTLGQYSDISLSEPLKSRENIGGSGNVSTGPDNSEEYGTSEESIISDKTIRTEGHKKPSELNKNEGASAETVPKTKSHTLRKGSESSKEPKLQTDQLGESQEFIASAEKGRKPKPKTQKPTRRSSVTGHSSDISPIGPLESRENTGGSTNVAKGLKMSEEYVTSEEGLPPDQAMRRRRPNEPSQRHKNHSRSAEMDEFAEKRENLQRDMLSFSPQTPPQHTGRVKGSQESLTSAEKTGRTTSKKPETSRRPSTLGQYSDISLSEPLKSRENTGGSGNVSTGPDNSEEYGTSEESIISDKTIRTEGHKKPSELNKNEGASAETVPKTKSHTLRKGSESSKEPKLQTDQLGEPQEFIASAEKGRKPKPKTQTPTRRSSVTGHSSDISPSGPLESRENTGGSTNAAKGLKKSEEYVTSEEGLPPDQAMRRRRPNEPSQRHKNHSRSAEMDEFAEKRENLQRDMLSFSPQTPPQHTGRVKGSQESLTSAEKTGRTTSKKPETSRRPSTLGQYSDVSLSEPLESRENTGGSGNVSTGPDNSEKYSTSEESIIADKTILTEGHKSPSELNKNEGASAETVAGKRKPHTLRKGSESSKEPKLQTDQLGESQEFIASAEKGRKPKTKTQKPTRRSSVTGHSSDISPSGPLESRENTGGSTNVAKGLKKSEEYVTSEEGLPPDQAMRRRRPNEPSQRHKNHSRSAEMDEFAEKRENLQRDMLSFSPQTPPQHTGRVKGSQESLTSAEKTGRTTSKKPETSRRPSTLGQYSDISLSEPLKSRENIGGSGNMSTGPDNSEEYGTSEESIISEKTIRTEGHKKPSELNKNEGSSAETEAGKGKSHTSRNGSESSQKPAPQTDQLGESQESLTSAERERKPTKRKQKTSRRPSTLGESGDISLSEPLESRENTGGSENVGTGAGKFEEYGASEENVSSYKTSKTGGHKKPPALNKNEGSSAETEAGKGKSHTSPNGSESSQKPAPQTDQLGESQESLTSAERERKPTKRKQKTSRRPSTLGESGDISLSEPLESRENTGGSGNGAIGLNKSQEYDTSEEGGHPDQAMWRRRPNEPFQGRKNYGGFGDKDEWDEKREKLQLDMHSKSPQTTTQHTGRVKGSQESLTSAEKARKTTSKKTETSRRPSTLGQYSDVSLSEPLESRENTGGSGNVSTGPDNSEKYSTSEESIIADKTILTEGHKSPSELNKNEGASAETVAGKRKPHTLRKGSESSNEATLQTQQLGESQEFIASAEKGRKPKTKTQKPTRRSSVTGHSSDISPSGPLESRENTGGSTNVAKGLKKSEEYVTSEEGLPPDQAMRRRRPNEPSQRHKNHSRSPEMDEFTEKRENLQRDMLSFSPQTQPQHTGRVKGSQESLTSAEKTGRTTSKKPETSRRPSTLGQYSDVSLSVPLESRENTGGSENVSKRPDNSEEYGTSEESISIEKIIQTEGHKKPSELNKNEGASAETVTGKTKSHTLRKGSESSKEPKPQTDQLGESQEFIASAEKGRKPKTKTQKPTRRSSVTGHSSDISPSGPLESRENTGGSPNVAIGLKKSEEYVTSEEGLPPDQAMRRRRPNEPSQRHKNHSRSAEMDEFAEKRENLQREYMSSRLSQTPPQHTGRVTGSRESLTSAEKTGRTTSKKPETSRRPSTLGQYSDVSLSVPLESRKNTGGSENVSKRPDNSEEYGTSEESISIEKIIQTEGHKKPSELNKNEGASAETVPGKTKSHTLRKGSESSKEPKLQTDQLGESQEFTASAEKGRKPKPKTQKPTRRSSVTGHSSDISPSGPLESRENTGGSTNVAKGLKKSEEYVTSEEGLPPDQAMRRRRPNEPSQRHKNHSRSAEMDEFAEKRENLQREYMSSRLSQTPPQHTGRVTGSRESLTSAEKARKTTSKKPDTSRRPSTLGQYSDVSLSEPLESRENTGGSGNVSTGPDNSERYSTSEQSIISDKSLQTEGHQKPSELNKNEGASAETVPKTKSHTLRKGSESSKEPTPQTDQLGESQESLTSAERERKPTTRKQQTSRKPSTLGESGDISLSEPLESRENTGRSENLGTGAGKFEEYVASEESISSDKTIRTGGHKKPPALNKNEGSSAETEAGKGKYHTSRNGSESSQKPAPQTDQLGESQESLTSAERERKPTTRKQKTSRRPSTLGESGDISLSEPLESRENTGGSENVGTGAGKFEEYGASEENVSSYKTSKTGGHKKPPALNKNEGSSAETEAGKGKSHTSRNGSESSQKLAPQTDQLGESQESLTSAERERKPTKRKQKTSRRPSTLGESGDISLSEPLASGENAGGSGNGAIGLNKSQEYDTSEEGGHPDQAMWRRRPNEPFQGRKNYGGFGDKDEWDEKREKLQLDMHSKSPQTPTQHTGRVKGSQESLTSAEKARKTTSKKPETSRRPSTLGQYSDVSLSEPLESRENTGGSGNVSTGPDNSEKYSTSEESIIADKTILTEGHKSPSELNKNEGASAETVAGKRKPHTLRKGSESSNEATLQTQQLGESQELIASAEKGRKPKTKTQKPTRRSSVTGHSSDISPSGPLESRENTGGSTNVAKGLKKSEEYVTSEEGLPPDQAMRRRRPNEPSQRHKNHSRSPEMDEFTEKRENLQRDMLSFSPQTQPQHTGRVKGSQESLTSAEKTGRTTSKKPETSRRPSTLGQYSDVSLSVPLDSRENTGGSENVSKRPDNSEEYGTSEESISIEKIIQTEGHKKPSELNKNEGASAETVTGKTKSHTLRKGSESSKEPKLQTDQLGESQEFIASAEKGRKPKTKTQKPTRRSSVTGHSSDISPSGPLESRENTGGSTNVAIGLKKSEEYVTSEEGLPPDQAMRRRRPNEPSQRHKNHSRSAEMDEFAEKRENLQREYMSSRLSQTPPQDTGRVTGSRESLTSAEKTGRTTSKKPETSRRPSTLGQYSDVSLSVPLESRENTGGSENVSKRPDNSEEYGTSEESISIEKIIQTEGHKKPSELNKNEGASAETVPGKTKSHTLRKGSESSKEPKLLTDQLGESQEFIASAEKGRKPKTKTQKPTRRSSVTGHSSDISPSGPLESRENTGGSTNVAIGLKKSEEHVTSEEGLPPDQAMRRRRPNEPSQRHKNHSRSAEMDEFAEKRENLQREYMSSRLSQTPPQDTGRVTGSRESLTSAEKARKTTSKKPDTSRRPSTLGQYSDVSLSEPLESRENTGGSGNVSTGPDNSERYSTSEQSIISDKSLQTEGHQKPSELNKNEGASAETVPKTKSHTLRKGSESSKEPKLQTDQLGESQESLTSAERERKPTTRKQQTSRKPSTLGESGDISLSEPLESRENTGRSENLGTGAGKFEEYVASEESISSDKTIRTGGHKKPPALNKNEGSSAETEAGKGKSHTSRNGSESSQKPAPQTDQLGESQESLTSAERERKPTTKKQKTSRRPSTLGESGDISRSEPLESRENTGGSENNGTGAGKFEENVASEENISSDKTIRTGGHKKQPALNKNEGSSAETEAGKGKSHTSRNGSDSSQKPAPQTDQLGESQESLTSAERERKPTKRKQKTSRRPSTLGESGDISLSEPLESRENTGGPENVGTRAGKFEEYGASEENISSDKTIRTGGHKKPPALNKNEGSSAETETGKGKSHTSRNGSESSQKPAPQTDQLGESQESLTSAERERKPKTRKQKTSRRPSTLGESGDISRNEPLESIENTGGSENVGTGAGKFEENVASEENISSDKTIRTGGHKKQPALNKNEGSSAETEAGKGKSHTSRNGSDSSQKPAPQTDQLGESQESLTSAERERKPTKRKQKTSRRPSTLGESGDISLSEPLESRENTGGPENVGTGAGKVEEYGASEENIRSDKTIRTGGHKKPPALNKNEGSSAETETGKGKSHTSRNGSESSQKPAPQTDQLGESQESLTAAERERKPTTRKQKTSRRPSTMGESGDISLSEPLESRENTGGSENVGTGAGKFEEYGASEENVSSYKTIRTGRHKKPPALNKNEGSSAETEAGKGKSHTSRNGSESSQKPAPQTDQLGESQESLTSAERERKPTKRKQKTSRRPSTLGESGDISLSEPLESRENTGGSENVGTGAGKFEEYGASEENVSSYRTSKTGGHKKPPALNKNEGSSAETEAGKGKSHTSRNGSESSQKPAPQTDQLGESQESLTSAERERKPTTRKQKTSRRPSTLGESGDISLSEPLESRENTGGSENVGTGAGKFEEYVASEESISSDKTIRTGGHKKPPALNKNEGSSAETETGKGKSHTSRNGSESSQKPAPQTDQLGESQKSLTSAERERKPTTRKQKTSRRPSTLGESGDISLSEPLESRENTGGSENVGTGAGKFEEYVASEESISSDKTIRTGGHKKPPALNKNEGSSAETETGKGKSHTSRNGSESSQKPAPQTDQIGESQESLTSAERERKPTTRKQKTSRRPSTLGESGDISLSEPLESRENTGGSENVGTGAGKFEEYVASEESISSDKTIRTGGHKKPPALNKNEGSSAETETGKGKSHTSRNGSESSQKPAPQTDQIGESQESLTSAERERKPTTRKQKTSRRPSTLGESGDISLSEPLESRGNTGGSENVGTGAGKFEEYVASEESISSDKTIRTGGHKKPPALNKNEGSSAETETGKGKSHTSRNGSESSQKPAPQTDQLGESQESLTSAERERKPTKRKQKTSRRPSTLGESGDISLSEPLESRENTGGSENVGTGAGKFEEYGASEENVSSYKTIRTGRHKKPPALNKNEGSSAETEAGKGKSHTSRNGSESSQKPAPQTDQLGESQESLTSAERERKPTKRKQKTSRRPSTLGESGDISLSEPLESRENTGGSENVGTGAGKFEEYVASEESISSDKTIRTGGHKKPPALNKNEGSSAETETGKGKSHTSRNGSESSQKPAPQTDQLGESQESLTSAERERKPTKRKQKTSRRPSTLGESGDISLSEPLESRENTGGSENVGTGAGKVEEYGASEENVSSDKTIRTGGHKKQPALNKNEGSSAETEAGKGKYHTSRNGSESSQKPAPQTDQLGESQESLTSAERERKPTTRKQKTSRRPSTLGESGDISLSEPLESRENTGGSENVGTGGGKFEEYVASEESISSDKTIRTGGHKKPPALNKNEGSSAETEAGKGKSHTSRNGSESSQKPAPQTDQLGESQESLTSAERERKPTTRKQKTSRRPSMLGESGDISLSEPLESRENTGGSENVGTGAGKFEEYGASEENVSSDKTIRTGRHKKPPALNKNEGSSAETEAGKGKSHTSRNGSESSQKPAPQTDQLGRSQESLTSAERERKPTTRKQKTSRRTLALAQSSDMSQTESLVSKESSGGLDNVAILPGNIQKKFKSPTKALNGEEEPTKSQKSPWPQRRGGEQIMERIVVAVNEGSEQRSRKTFIPRDFRTAYGASPETLISQESRTKHAFEDADELYGESLSEIPRKTIADNSGASVMEKSSTEESEEFSEEKRPRTAIQRKQGEEKELFKPRSSLSGKSEKSGSGETRRHRPLKSPTLVRGKKRRDREGDLKKSNRPNLADESNESERGKSHGQKPPPHHKKRIICREYDESEEPSKLNERKSKTGEYLFKEYIKGIGNSEEASIGDNIESEETTPAKRINPKFQRQREQVTSKKADVKKCESTSTDSESSKFAKRRSPLIDNGMKLQPYHPRNLAIMARPAKDGTSNEKPVESKSDEGRKSSKEFMESIELRWHMFNIPKYIKASNGGDNLRKRHHRCSDSEENSSYNSDDKPRHIHRKPHRKAHRSSHTKPHRRKFNYRSLNSYE